ncbi:MAG: hypothetical protein GDA36_09865 [Rhodobacteraceae bacterium]|nr:hypothetical protein [Paracoccaceae bacterium]
MLELRNTKHENARIQSLSQIQASRAPLIAFVSPGFVRGSFVAQVPELKARIGASDATFGMIFLISSIGAMAAMWIASAMDRWLRDQGSRVATALMAVTLLLPEMTFQVRVLVVAIFLLAAASGATDVLMNVRVSGTRSRIDRSLMSPNHAIYSFACARAALLTGIACEAGSTGGCVWHGVCRHPDTVSLDAGRRARGCARGKDASRSRQGSVRGCLYP